MNGVRRSSRLRNHNKKRPDRLSWVNLEDDGVEEDDTDQEMEDILSELDRNNAATTSHSQSDNDDDDDDDDDDDADHGHDPDDNNNENNNNEEEQTQPVQRSTNRRGAGHPRTATNPRGAGRPRGSRNRRTAATAPAAEIDEPQEDRVAPESDAVWKRGQCLPNSYIADFGRHNSYYSKRLSAFKKSMKHQLKMNSVCLLAVYNARKFGIDNGIDYLHTPQFDLALNEDIMEWLQYCISTAFAQILLRKQLSLDPEKTLIEQLQQQPPQNGNATDVNQDIEKLLQFNVELLKQAHNLSENDGIALEYAMATAFHKSGRAELYRFLHAQVIPCTERHPDDDSLRLPVVDGVVQFPTVPIPPVAVNSGNNNRENNQNMNNDANANAEEEQEEDANASAEEDNDLSMMNDCD